MSAALRWLATAALVALLAHLAATWYAPRYIMQRTMDAVAASDGANVFINRPVGDAECPRVVRPSPDLMYSLCVLDLAAGPVRIRAPASTPYTSVSVFAANSDNVFVQNDRALADAAAGFDVVGGARRTKRSGRRDHGATAFRARTVPVRRGITDAQQAQELDELRRQALCEAG